MFNVLYNAGKFVLSPLELLRNMFAWAILEWSSLDSAI
jgi:hypothetical protein